jgi:hypothetical protein
MSPRRHVLHLAAVGIIVMLAASAARGDEPPAINPFGQTQSARDDALPGCVELSDGSKHRGLIYLTRGKRLQVYDEEAQRQREVPLQAIKQIDGTIVREWREKEWKFKETTSDEKMYTGRSYPVRQYEHTITLKDGRTITGSLSAIIYLQSERGDTARPEQFLLNKRNKGNPGQNVKSMVYVKRITLEKEGGEKD